MPELRLLVVTHYYSTHLGGIEIIAEEVARRLASTHAVVWAASDCDPVPSGDRITYAPMRVANAVERLCGVPLPLWGPQSCARLWRLVGASDAVHLHDFAYMGNVVAFIAARWFGKPVVVTQHIGVVPYRSGLLRFVQRMAHATLGRLVLGGARQVVFYSDVVRRYYEGFIRFRQPPVMLANGVDTDTFAAAAAGDRARARGALGLDPGKPVALFVGRFVEKKGLHILEALARRYARRLVGARGLGADRSAPLGRSERSRSRQPEGTTIWCRSITRQICWCCPAWAKGSPWSCRKP